VAKLSAGLLLYRLGDGTSFEVLLVHPGGPFWRNKDAHAWSVPKGEHDAGENAEQAAVREFAEELGCPPPSGARMDLGEIRQSGGKRVRVWAIRAQDFSIADVVSNEFEIEWPPRSGRRQSFPEVDRAEWMGPELARERLVRGQAEFIDRLSDRIAVRA
jgi:predicted NUDIX family NTP pyrophosphohydrolase